MLKDCLFAATLWFVAVYATAAQATLPELEWCLDDYPNRHHYPDQGSPYGPTVDFMFELARRADIQLRFSPNTPFARCVRLMEQGKTDLMVRLKTSAERERFMFMLPFAEAQAEILVLHKDSPDITTLAELNRLNLIVIRGYTYHSEMINIIARHPRSIVVDSIDIGLQMLLMNRGDALVTDADYFYRRTHDKPEYQDQLKLASLSFEEAEPHFMHLALSKASPHAHLKARLEQAIASMIADGLMDSFTDN
ncbi:transporter substrate-binding domain-containing protein [Alkalimonas sp.]|uniref:substrate-binding periplasmic protein n=1 Tax=Alkalimonas sp. TaxID=1872453 RepID=UPI00263A6EE0|nr:transporter substrate-binding domain-containing protein [Alkalimonas sp.]MCC5827381.1 transporter substrate-binding domain-containing protein [Alkalimonas sp.]